MRALVMALLVACGGTQRVKLHVDFALVADLDHSGIVRGIITTDSAQPAAGATVAITHANTEVAAITDENGSFVMTQALPEGTYTMQVYYVETKLERPVEVKAGFATVVRISGLRDPPGEI